MFVKVGDVYLYSQARRPKLEWIPLHEFNRRNAEGEECDLRVYDFDHATNMVAVMTFDNIELKENAIPTLPKGIYHIRYSMEKGYYFVPEGFKQKDTFIAGGETEQKIRGAIKRFEESRDRYAKFKIPHRRGVLCYGPPGNGKTRTVIELLKELSADNWCFITDQAPDPRFKMIFRDLPVVYIIEEVTQIRSSLADFLNFMDGVDSLNEALVICTTNYPDHLPSNILDRPSRFDELVSCRNPSARDRAMYLTTFFNRGLTEEEKKCFAEDSPLVQETKGMSVAYLKEIVLYARIKPCTLEESIQAQRDRRLLIKSDFDEGTQDHLNEVQGEKTKAGLRFENRMFGGLFQMPRPANIIPPHGPPQTQSAPLD